jgi:hypothetical protein
MHVVRIFGGGFKYDDDDLYLVLQDLVSAVFLAGTPWQV